MARTEKELEFWARYFMVGVETWILHEQGKISLPPMFDGDGEEAGKYDIMKYARLFANAALDEYNDAQIR